MSPAGLRLGRAGVVADLVLAGLLTTFLFAVVVAAWRAGLLRALRRGDAS